MSKHEEIINHIMSLKAGTKISVRGIASNLSVSEGTAYRAIKECDNLGLVTTIPRVGTVRIKKVEKKNIEALTYREIVSIIEGSVIGGANGIDKVLKKFVIGAMTTDVIGKYIDPGSLMIVGNREDVQKLAILNNMAVLITGGFDCSNEIKRLANERCLPVISSNYDTFTIASIINKAISENLIKKDIILVEDIMEEAPKYLRSSDSVEKLRSYSKEFNMSVYSVVDKNKKLIGIISVKDVVEVKGSEAIEKYINRKPLTVNYKTTVAYIAHVMGWEKISMCPVVDNNDKLLGTVTSVEVIKALQYILRQPQIGEKLEDLILKNFDYSYVEDGMEFSGKIVTEMLEPIGTVSWNSLNMLLSTAGVMTLKQQNNTNISIDSISTYFLKPVQMDNIINIHTRVLSIGRYFGKLEVDMVSDNGESIAKSILSVKLLKV
ncbi:DRTGG domain-containing protein [Clostridium felsineum]|uniref:DRTGG domain-containing protein n=1 Tax=Clostridium felsineum TaxID=36839 RepID=UPI00098C5EB5|nr:DRTGG domain-containing protein [Clostridium felsineum]URZ17933.1 Inosine-5'-monophosphate dehydrogenase [Clostridium felsineum DSM 794]